MEKPNLNISLSNSLRVMREAVARSMNPNIMWRVVIVSFLCGVIAIGVFAYFTYSWAVKVEVIKTTPNKDLKEFSIDELRGAIKAYQAKEETYNRLLRARPTPPDYARGKGLMSLSEPLREVEVGTSTIIQSTSTPPVLR